MAIKKNLIGTQHHHKIILHSSCHVQRVLVVATKVERGIIRVDNEWFLVIMCAPISRTVTKRATSCHHRWYLFLLHWIIKSLINLSCPRFVNSHQDLHRTILVITSALTERPVTQRAMICYHQWYQCLLHRMINSLIHLSCPRFVISHPALHITQHMSCKILQYPVRIHLIPQIPCHFRRPIMEVAIFMDAWFMCLSWHRHNDNRMT